MSKKILVIGDTQCRPDIDLQYMANIGKYIVDKRPDVIVHIGDHFDFESLSSYDKGKRSMEGRRLVADLAAGHKGMELLMAPLLHLQAQQRRFRKKVYDPQMELCLGNHEERFDRMANDNPELEGFVGTKTLNLEQYGWRVHPFLKPAVIEGIHFVHYLANPFTGRPYGGTALSQLKAVGTSFVVGHKQVLDIAMTPILDGSMRLGLINGACLTPDHKVLHADLVYRELGELQVGDRLVSFEEQPDGRRARRFKTGTVQAVKRVVKPVFEVLLESGKSFKVTEDHRWVVKLNGAYQWRETVSLRKGTRIPKFLSESELCIQGKVREIAETSGVLQPSQLIPKFVPEHLGRLTCDKGMLDTVVSVTALGDAEVVMTQIDEGTMIVEGYGHHNCYEHDEAYKGHQGNTHFRGVVMLHEVANGFGLPMPVSLDYLRKRYT